MALLMSAAIILPMDASIVAEFKSPTIRSPKDIIQFREQFGAKGLWYLLMLKCGTKTSFLMAEILSSKGVIFVQNKKKPDLPAFFNAIGVVPAADRSRFLPD